MIWDVGGTHSTAFELALNAAEHTPLDRESTQDAAEITRYSYREMTRNGEEHSSLIGKWPVNAAEHTLSIGEWPIHGTGMIITPSVVSLQFDGRSFVIDSTNGFGISEGSYGRNRLLFPVGECDRSAK